MNIQVLYLLATVGTELFLLLNLLMHLLNMSLQIVLSASFVVTQMTLDLLTVSLVLVMIKVSHLLITNITVFQSLVPVLLRYVALDLLHVQLQVHHHLATVLTLLLHHGLALVVLLLQMNLQLSPGELLATLWTILQLMFQENMLLDIKSLGSTDWTDSLTLQMQIFVLLGLVKFECKLCGKPLVTNLTHSSSVPVDVRPVVFKVSEGY